MVKKIGLILLPVLLISGMTGCKGERNSEPQSPLVAIEVTPAEASIAVNTDQQFIATGIYADNSTMDLTAIADWTSSDENVATVGIPPQTDITGSAAPAIDKPGRVHASKEGTATITASWSGKKGLGHIKVKGVKLVFISITPADPVIGKGTSQQFTATGIFSDNTTQDITASAAWSSSNTAVAAISNDSGSNGLATAIDAGTTTISAGFGSISGTMTLTVNPATLVSLTVTPANPGIARGTTGQFTATGTYSDNTTQDLTASATWTSSDPAVATISNAAGSNGLATSIAAGSTTITATSGSVSGATTLTVNPATLVSLTVTPANPGIAKGTKQQFTTTGIYSDNTTQDLTASVTWSSSNTGVATISNAAGSKGLATSVAAGSTTITAVSGALAGSTTLTVNPATLISITVTPENPSIGKGTSRQFTATGTFSDSTTQDLTAAVTWSSSNTAIATISNAAGSKGLATSVAAGSTTITATSGGISGTSILTVSDASATLTWDAPTTNEDGTALTDLAGYTVYYGTSSGNYTTTINTGNVTTYVVNNLNPGTYYFAVTAVNSAGSESAYSNEASKTIY